MLGSDAPQCDVDSLLDRLGPKLVTRGTQNGFIDVHEVLRHTSQYIGADARIYAEAGGWPPRNTQSSGGR